MHKFAWKPFDLACDIGLIIMSLLIILGIPSLFIWGIYSYLTNN